MMMTGTAGASRLIFSSSEMPSIPGMRTSEMMTSGFSRPSFSSTSLGSEKPVITMPSMDKAFSSTQRMDLSSSTIQTFLFSGMFVSHREENTEYGFLFSTLIFNQTAMRVDQRLCYR